MEDWQNNEKLVNAYVIAWDEAYGTNSFRGFLEVMEKKMSLAVQKYLQDKLAWDDTLEQIMVDAEAHFADMSARYAEMK